MNYVIIHIVGMSPSISTAELIDAIALIAASPNQVTKADEDLTGRRVRHWTNSGVLRPLGGVHIGKGRSRTYPQSEIYIAAALMLMAENDQGVDVLTHAAGVLRNLSGPEPLIAGRMHERWSQAINGSAEIFFFAGAGGRPNSRVPRYTITSMMSAEEMPTEIHALPPGGAYVNLTTAFRLIRL